MVALLFCPSRIHSQEHARPVLGIGPPDTAFQREDGVVLVVFVRKENLEMHRIDFLPEVPDLEK